MSIKHKLIKKYFHDDFIPESARLTPLRRFLYTIGFDYKDLTRSEVDKWARTKRFKDFFKLYKIKKIADKAHVDEEIVFNNLEIFLSKLEIIEEEQIYLKEEQDFQQILEYVAPTISKGFIRKTRKVGKRGKYKHLPQRQQFIKKQILQTLNTGGEVSTGESQIRFRSGKKMNNVAGRNKVILKKRIPNKNLSYRRSTIRTY